MSKSVKRLPKEIRAMVNGGTMLLQIAIGLVQAIVGKGGTPEQVHALTKPEGKNLFERMAALVVGTVAASVVQVAWDGVLKWVIAACRFVTYGDPNITGANFPLVPGDLAMKDVLIVKIKEKMSTPAVLNLLDEQGLRPATLMELLWWWLTHPTEQADCLVVALGSVWRGCAPYVNGYGGFRGLCLSALAGGWNDYYAFAAVRK